MPPMNPIKTYINAGTLAGRAVNNRDAALAAHWRGWVRQALSLENEPYKTTARSQYELAYEKERAIALKTHR